MASSSFSSYSSYLKAMGAKKGEYNPFIMTLKEFNGLKQSMLTVEEKHAQLEQRLVDCQNAWYSSMMNNMLEDAAHAKINERNAYKALIAFEKENGLYNE